MATRQPSFIGPTRFCFGTRTLSKKVSLNSEFPVICFRGLTVMPGLCMSTRRKEMPRCFGALESVRTSRIHQSAYCPILVQIFCPLTTKSSPSRTAFVCSEARSEPELGSENPWHQIRSEEHTSELQSLRHL